MDVRRKHQEKWKYLPSLRALSVSAATVLSGLYTLNSPKYLLPLAKIVSKIKASRKRMKTQLLYAVNMYYK
ncbi:hypothetical protein VNO78_05954 [Psophocarpus tetragonolobus]|uniref:Uncharacterized protein n=1 Tax=Psophocarpus tetragonolobus TaxID=3891 RepID=A0AAN9XR36_PSOTE